MDEKLRIPVKSPDECGDQACAVKVSKKAMTLIKQLCTETNRSQCDVASRLIEWAYDRTEVTDATEGGEDA